MPVRRSKTKDVVIIKIEAGENGEQEVYRCKWINERTMNQLYAEMGDFDEASGEFQMEAKRFAEYSYTLAQKILIGWSGVKDPDAEDPEAEIKFNKMLIGDLEVGTVCELAEKYMAIRAGAKVKREEEIKNSESTSPSAETSQPSRDAGDVPSPTKSTS
jgi:hypothetical protein